MADTSEPMTMHEGMQELFVRARREHLWFHSNYQDLWFSPAQLEREQANGRFLWGPANWTLEHPENHAAALVRLRDSIQIQIDDINLEIAKGWD